MQKPEGFSKAKVFTFSKPVPDKPTKAKKPKENDMKRHEHCWGCGSDHQPPMCDEKKDDKSTNIKPPLGLKPKYIHNYEREIDIVKAMERYVEAGKIIPIEWFNELNCLMERRIPI